MDHALLDQFLAIIQHSGVTLPDLERIPLDTPLANLGLDSTDLLTILFELEERLDIRLQSFEGEINTLRDLFDAVSSLLSARDGT